MLAIRSAHIDDARTLCAAEQEIARTPGRLISQPAELTPEAFGALIDKLAGGDGCYLVAEDESGLVGHALLQPLERIAIAHVFQMTIAVHPGKSGKGIGTALMRSLCDWARTSSGVHKVELSVRSTNARALALYRKFGFVEEGRLRDRVRLPDGTHIDDILMAWFPHRGTTQRAAT
jgi:RimJ/RimL family protein N-acetyltransferase